MSAPRRQDVPFERPRRTERGVPAPIEDEGEDEDDGEDGKERVVVTIVGCWWLR